MLKWAATAMLIAAAVPAEAAQWYYVDSASDYSNISFIDKDSIRAAGSHQRAEMFSLLANPGDDGIVAYRFSVEFDCAGGQSRLAQGQMLKGDGTALAPMSDMGGAWEKTTPGSQGASIIAFVCSGGAKAEAKNAAGSALPFATGRQMLERLRNGERF